jgi:hypothetical protein
MPVQGPTTRLARRLLPTIAALLCIAPVTIAASGCGSDSLPDPVASAVAATRSTDGAKVQMKIGIQGTGSPKGLAMQADGVADMKDGEMQMTLDLGGLGAALGGSGAANVDPADLKTELRLVDKTLYMQMGALQKQLPKGKKWLELDAEKISRNLGIDVSQLSQYNDPTKMLDYLRSSGKVEEVGSEDVRGVSTKHYRAIVDLAEAAKKLSGPSKASGAGMEQLVKFLGDSKVPVDVYIGDDKLVRRMTMRLTPSGAAAASGFEMNMNMDLYDYGTPVNVSAPPKSEVYDGSKLLSAGATGAGASAGSSAGSGQTP